MSHFTTIKTQIKDLDALAAAVLELGLRLERKTHPDQALAARGYYNNQQPADAVIRLKGPYDVAVTRQPDGSYALTCDWYAGHVASECGENYRRVLQGYGVHKTMMEARKKGWQARRVMGSNGAVNVVITGGNL